MLYRQSGCQRWRRFDGSPISSATLPSLCFIVKIVFFCRISGGLAAFFADRDSPLRWTHASSRSLPRGAKDRQDRWCGRIFRGGGQRRLAAQPEPGSKDHGEQLRDAGRAKCGSYAGSGQSARRRKGSCGYAPATVGFGSRRRSGWWRRSLRHEGYEHGAGGNGEWGT